MRCGNCGHEWVATTLPLEINKVANIMRRAACPACGETKKLFLATAPSPRSSIGDQP